MSIARRICLLNREVDLVDCQDSRYKYFSTTSNYGGIPQKWVLFQSQPMQEHKEKTFERQLAKEKTQAEKSLAKLKRREFACEADARKEAELWLAEHPFCRSKDLSVKLVTRRNGKMRGRPRKGEELRKVHQIEAEIEFNAEKVAEVKSKLGMFILATNDLKHSIAEWMLRKRMRETGETTPNQLKKQTQKPTLKWIVFLFMGVTEVTVWTNGEMYQQIANLNDNLVKIIRLFGPACEKYYGLER